MQTPLRNTLLLLTVALILAGCGRDDDAILKIRTGFELRAGEEWTSLPEEEAFLEELDATSDRVTVTEVGRSVQNRPIRLITVTDADARADIADGSSILFVCSQHGSEPAGREACLAAARDVAADQSVGTVLIMPTANPDGLAEEDRLNANDMDMNRDHAILATPEAAAVARVISDYKPDLVGDFHEYQEPGASTVLLSNPDRLHLNVEPRIQALAGQTNRYAESTLAAGEFDTGLYPSSGPHANEGVMRQQAALRHSPSLLVETPRRGTLSPIERVTAQRAAMNGLFDMMRGRRREIAAATAAAAGAAVDEGSDGDERYYYRSPTNYSDAPPCGYTLSDDAYRTVQRRLELHDVEAAASGDSWTIRSAQPAQPMIGLLLDERAPHPLAVGAPVACPSG